ncbi:MAG: low temperature requirement protein A [Dehalococcoidia bacterium]|jgi:low temperature requirement protein LtrA
MVQAPPHTHHTHPSGVFRVRVPGEHSRVTNFELFFDLVFVFAVTQLSHKLAGHLTADGLLHTTILMLAVWWAWMYTTWATNWCDPDHLAVRVVLVGIMLGGLIMAASIPEAFDGRGLGFAAPYVAIQVGRSAFLCYAGREDRAFLLNFTRITLWLAFAGVFWIAGAFAHDSLRVGLWVTALAIEYVGPSVRFWLPKLGSSAVADWTVEGAHLAERCGLFIIIALGESLLVTGATFSGLPWTVPVIAAMVAAFGAAVAMWWVYFDVTAEAATERIAHSEEPGGLARLAYTYFHLPMVAGIIVAAVGDEIVLAHPRGGADLSTALAIVGGPALFLVGYSLFKRAVLGRFFAVHLVALAALIALFLSRPAASPVVLTIGTTLVLVALAARSRKAHRAELFELEFESEPAR